MLIRALFNLLASAWCVLAADPFSLVGTVINTTEPEKPMAAPARLDVNGQGACELTISPPLVGSGVCSIKVYEEKSGHIEITSTGSVNIAWTGVVKGNIVSGSYRVDPGMQIGNFYFAIVRPDTVAVTPNPQPIPRSAPSSQGPCVPAIESSISGEFHGWDGDTIFKLDNGQIWEQAEYEYTYSYSYHPDVTIYQTSSGCRMKVEDENETLIVKRIK
jgi:hypothetical protein